jgi:hypothetical protein
VQQRQYHPGLPPNRPRRRSHHPTAAHTTASDTLTKS